MHISVLASETPFWKTYSWENQMTKQRRVVITGIGILSPVGLTLDENWENITNGRSGIGHITQFDTTDFSCKIAGEVEGFNPDNYMAAKDAKRMDRFIQLGYAASMDAFKDSGLEVTEQKCRAHWHLRRLRHWRYYHYRRYNNIVKRTWATSRFTFLCSWCHYQYDFWQRVYRARH